VGVTDSLTGTADVLNINLTQTADTAFGTVTASNVETLNIVSTDSNTTVAGTTDHTLTVVDTAAKSIVVTGNAHLSLTQASTALTSVDASGMTVAAATAGADTQGLNFISGDLAQAATATGSAGVDSLDFSAVSTSKSMTINGGLGGKAGATGDTLIGGAGDDTITFSGLGNATLTGGAGKDTITGSTGNDTITGGAGADTLTGSGGNDAFGLAAVSDSAPSAFDTITDFVAKTATTAGDTIAFDNLIFASSDTAVTVFVANSGSLALAALSSATRGADVINVALDSSTGTLYIDGTGAVAGTSDGTADMALVLTGVTTITADAFAIS
jgi:S-layer protein